ncbi:Lysozyme M1 precursor [Actinomyces bovis]|uniref:Lysozyme M1 n=1 Tax=Actinomyces bovis TaxID=1658 RepID=A0ABY1VLZ2_9ACTO|nr:GH25 family lysozyme [Actinomyces bovis]SPT53095.1 Lysozyme M1 precursor [Actinomyces bovis]
MLRIVDVSSWQKGINLSALDCDGAVVKATQGTSYVNPDCVRAVEQCLAAGKATGVYHYISGITSPEVEADFFIDQIQGWSGRVVLALDWEQHENYAWGNADWLWRMARRTIERTGIKPIIYASASVFPWNTCTELDLGAWVAQYADMSLEAGRAAHGGISLARR